MGIKGLRLRIIREVFFKELRETLRDKRSLLIMFGVPLLLYPMLTLSTATLGQQTAKRMQQADARVAVRNAEAAPGLVKALLRPKSGIRLTEVDDPETALKEDRLDAVIIVPAGYEKDVLASKNVELSIQVDRSRSHTDFTEGKIERAVDAYEDEIVKKRLAQYGAPESAVRSLETKTIDTASGDGRFGRMLSMLLPMMLLLTGMLGAFFPAITATTAERELNTLEALLVTPAGRMEILLGKTILVVLSALLTSALNMISMSLVLWRTVSMATSMASNVAPGLQLDAGALGLAYVAAMPTILFFSATVMVVGLFARNYREANSYVTPVMLLSMAPLFVSVMDPTPSLGLLVTPAINSTIVIREVLTGHVEALHYLIAFGSSCLYAGLMLSLAARLFSNEQLVNPAWEPLSTKGLLTRRTGPRPQRLPAIDEALALYAVSLLLNFYIAPEWLKAGLLTTLAGVEILLIAAPAIVFAQLGRYRWRETFSFRSVSPRWFLGAALMALGVLPWMFALVGVQYHIWPPDPATSQAMEKLFRPALERDPWVTILAVGLLAGVCEELLYRGPVQAALMQKMRPWYALWIGGFLFAAAHVDPAGMAYRTLLGVLLGWIVWRSGSVFPAMLAHMLIDSVNLGLARFAPKGTLWDPELALHAGGPTTPQVWTQLAIGTVLVAIGWVLCRVGGKAREPIPF
jgi:ABC-type Na+ efflux pump permease subunit/membrane protease YdiL (CAAX protease family)